MTYSVDYDVYFKDGKYHTLLNHACFSDLPSIADNHIIDYISYRYRPSYLVPKEVIDEYTEAIKTQFGYKDVTITDTKAVIHADQPGPVILSFLSCVRFLDECPQIPLSYVIYKNKYNLKPRKAFLLANWLVITPELALITAGNHGLFQVNYTDFTKISNYDSWEYRHNLPSFNFSKEMDGVFKLHIPYDRDVEDSKSFRNALVDKILRITKMSNAFNGYYIYWNYADIFRFKDLLKNMNESEINELIEWWRSL